MPPRRSNNSSFSSRSTSARNSQTRPRARPDADSNVCNRVSQTHPPSSSPSDLSDSDTDSDQIANILSSASGVDFETASRCLKDARYKCRPYLASPEHEQRVLSLAFDLCSSSNVIQQTAAMPADGMTTTEDGGRSEIIREQDNAFEESSRKDAEKDALKRKEAEKEIQKNDIKLRSWEALTQKRRSLIHKLSAILRRDNSTTSISNEFVRLSFRFPDGYRPPSIMFHQDDDAQSIIDMATLIFINRVTEELNEELLSRSFEVQFPLRDPSLFDNVTRRTLISGDVRGSLSQNEIRDMTVFWVVLPTTDND